MDWKKRFLNRSFLVNLFLIFMVCVLFFCVGYYFAVSGEVYKANEFIREWLSTDPCGFGNDNFGGDLVGKFNLSQFEGLVGGANTS